MFFVCKSYFKVFATLSKFTSSVTSTKLYKLYKASHTVAKSVQRPQDFEAGYHSCIQIQYTGKHELTFIYVCRLIAYGEKESVSLSLLYIPENEKGCRK